MNEHKGFVLIRGHADICCAIRSATKLSTLAVAIFVPSIKKRVDDDREGHRGQSCRPHAIYMFFPLCTLN